MKESYDISEKYSSSFETEKSCTKKCSLYDKSGDCAYYATIDDDADDMKARHKLAKFGLQIMLLLSSAFLV